MRSTLPNRLHRRVPSLIALVLFFCLGATGSTAAAADVLGAARDGDPDALRAALTETRDPQPADLARPLYLASRGGHGAAVEILLEAGADPETAFSFGGALHVAARGDYVEIVRLMIANGANPDMVAGEFDRTAIHEAAENNALRVAHLLIESGAEVHPRDKRGQPPVHLASRRGHVAMSALLSEAGGPIEPPPPVSDAEIASADLKMGRRALLACNTCHEIAKGTSATGIHAGPSLVGVFGRPVADLEGYDYSPALRLAGGHWSTDALNAFLADPTGTYPGTEMLRTPEMSRAQRIALIAYLLRGAR